MEREANYLKVIVITALLLIGLAGSALWLSPWALHPQDDAYDLVFDGPVKGLAVGSEVEFNGVVAGRVTGLTLDPARAARVIARVALRRGTPVRVASEPRIKSPLVGRAVSVAITPGPADSPLLKTQHSPTLVPVLVGRRSAVDNAMENSSELLARTHAILAQVNRTLSDNNIERVSHNVTEMEDRTARLGRLTPGLDGFQSALKTSSPNTENARMRAVSMRRTVAILADRAAGARDTTARIQTDLRALSGTIEKAEGRIKAAADQDLPTLTQRIEATGTSVGGLTSTLERLRSGPFSVGTDHPESRELEVEP